MLQNLQASNTLVRNKETSPNETKRAGTCNCAWLGRGGQREVLTISLQRWLELQPPSKFENDRL